MADDLKTKIEELNDAIGGAIWVAHCVVNWPRYTVSDDGGIDCSQIVQDLKDLKKIAEGSGILSEIAMKVLVVLKKFKEVEHHLAYMGNQWQEEHIVGKKEGVLKIMDKSFELYSDIVKRREEFLKAFIAETSLKPSEVEMVTRYDIRGMVAFFRKRS